MKAEILETERLILRPLTMDDVPLLFLLDSDPEVMRYIGLKPVTTVEESREVIRKILKQYDENGIGRFAVIEKESNLLIGWSGLKYLTEEINGIKDVYEIGYRFLPESWGKGYATESAKAWIDYGFESLNIVKIVACAHCENDASNYVLKKLGFSEMGTFIDDLDGAECFWYEFRKENFKK